MQYLLVHHPRAADRYAQCMFMDVKLALWWLGPSQQALSIYPGAYRSLDSILGDAAFSEQCTRVILGLCQAG